MPVIETENWVKNPDRPGTVIFDSLRPAQDVFDDLKAHLEADGRMPDEYFLFDAHGSWREGAMFPKDGEIICNVNYGGSEGVYLDIFVKYEKEVPEYNETKKKAEHIKRTVTEHFATGKTLGESIEDLDRMNLVASSVTAAFYGSKAEVKKRYAKIERGEEQAVYPVLQKEVKSLSDEAEQTAETVFCDVQPGDWVIALPSEEYGCMVGVVTAADRFGTAEHKTGSRTDDIHVNFMSVEYSKEAKAHFAEAYENKTNKSWDIFEKLPRDNVIMAPDKLLSINGLKPGEIDRLAANYKEAKAYCDSITGSFPKKVKAVPDAADQSAETLSGCVQPGDWVIAAGGNDYRYLLGMVTAIDKHGSPGHETENETDDVHVDFTAFDYPTERIAEIEERFALLTGKLKTFSSLPLDDVIMAPKMLIRISHLSKDEITFMGNLRHNCEAFCNCFPGGINPRNAKQAKLISRLEQNYADYHKLLMGFGKHEIIDMAEKINLMSDAHTYMTNSCHFSDDEADFLLKFQNPLEVMAEGLREFRNDDDSDIEYAFADLLPNKQDWLDSYPLVSAMPPAGNEMPAADKLPEPEKSKQPAAEKPKLKTFAEKLQAAKEKSKAQDAQGGNMKSHKREERE